VSEPSQSATSYPNDQLSAPAAYERCLQEIQALPQEKSIHINLEIPLVVTTVLGAAQEIRLHRDALAYELPRLPLALLDNIVMYARALSHAHARYVAAKTPLKSFPELVEEGTKLRDLLYPDVMALVNRGMLDGAQFKEVKSSTAHRQLGVDLQVLAIALKEKWDLIAGKTFITSEELDRAVYLADRLQDAVGIRAEAPEQEEAATRLRAQAYSFLIYSYEEIRFAIGYVRRHHGDAEAIAPSVFSVRAPRRPTAAAAPASEPVPPVTTPAPEPAPPAPTLPQNNGVPVGLPGHPPFIRS
jgi:hypothetical protein